MNFVNEECMWINPLYNIHPSLLLVLWDDDGDDDDDEDSDEVKCSLHNGNAETNFGDKLSSSLSGMNNLSYTNSKSAFLLNF